MARQDSTNVFSKAGIIYLLDEFRTPGLQNINQAFRTFDRHVWYQMFEGRKEFQKFLIQIIIWGGGLASIDALCLVLAVCTSTHKQSYLVQLPFN